MSEPWAALYWALPIQYVRFRPKPQLLEKLGLVYIEDYFNDLKEEFLGMEVESVGPDAASTVVTQTFLELQRLKCLKALNTAIGANRNFEDGDLVLVLHHYSI